MQPLTIAESIDALSIITKGACVVGFGYIDVSNIDTDFTSEMLKESIKIESVLKKMSPLQV